MLDKEFVENLTWSDVVNEYGLHAEDEDNFIMKFFGRTLWHYNAGEFDMSEYMFDEEKGVALKMFK